MPRSISLGVFSWTLCSSLLGGACSSSEALERRRRLPLKTLSRLLSERTVSSRSWGDDDNATNVTASSIGALPPAVPSPIPPVGSPSPFPSFAPVPSAVPSAAPHPHPHPTAAPTGAPHSEGGGGSGGGGGGAAPSPSPPAPSASSRSSPSVPSAPSGPSGPSPSASAPSTPSTPSVPSPSASVPTAPSGGSEGSGGSGGTVPVLMPSNSAPYGVPAQGEGGAFSPPPSPGSGGGTEGGTGVSSSMPPTSAPSVCEAAHPDWLGDGWCDGSSAYNSAACGYDHGDCCPLTCLPGRPFACGSNGFVCWDPQQTHVNASLLSMRFLVANASASASADRLQGMVALAISPYLTGSGALDIRSLSVQVTAGMLPAVPALRPLSLSLRHHHMVTAATAAVSSNYTVSAQMVYSAFPNASASVAFLAASVSSGDMQKVLRMLASDMGERQFIGVLVCSEANTTACTTQEVQPTDDDANTSSSSTSSSCSRDSSGWVRWYGSPVSVVWQWAMLACWSAALPVPLMTMMMKAKAKADRATSLAQCAAVLARMLYHIFVLVEAMQTPNGYDDMACIELSFADADWDPAFTMLQSLFYLSLLCAAALDTGSRRRAWRPWLGIVQAVVLGLLIWQCQVVIARHDAVMGQVVRIAAQCFAGGALLLLSVAALGGWLRCCSMLLAGTLTVVTAAPAVLASPAAAFLLYTVLARLGEIACLCCLQMDQHQHPIRSTKRHRLRAAVEEKEEDEQAEAEGVEQEERREGSRAEGEGQSMTAAVPVHDRVFPEPRLPSWISRWTYAYAYSRASYQSVQESSQDQGQGQDQGHSLRSIVAAQRGLG